jgi:hypothetical protein
MFLTSAAIAQVSAGFKAGGIGATQFGDIEDATMKIGFFGGPFITLPAGESFEFQPEVRFSMEGTKYDAAGQSATLKLSYIEVPVLFKIKILQENDIRPSLYLGPEVSMLLSAKAKVLETETDVKDNVNNIDAGAVFGVEFNNDRKLVSDFRVGVGLLNTVDVDGSDETNRNLNISVAIGLRF